MVFRSTPGRRHYIRTVMTATVLGALVATSIAHAGTKLLGVYKDWTAQTYTHNGASVCMMWSQPHKAEGNYTSRGEIYVFVTHRPAQRRLNEIRFESGYPFKAGTEVDVTIGDQHFTLSTDATTAWSNSPPQAQKMVQSMRAGRSMVVEGISRRGTHTTDTYSLQGFTAAHKAINKACAP